MEIISIYFVVKCGRAEGRVEDKGCRGVSDRIG